MTRRRPSRPNSNSMAEANPGAARCRDQGQRAERDGRDRDKADRQLPGGVSARGQPGHRTDGAGERRHAAGRRCAGGGRRSRRRTATSPTQADDRDRRRWRSSSRGTHAGDVVLGLAGLAVGRGARLADRPRHLAPGGPHVRGDAGARGRRQDGRDPRRRPQGRDRPDGRHGRRVQDTT